MSSPNGDRLDLDEEFLPEQSRHLHERAGGKMTRIEELIANGAEGRELAHVSHEGRQFDQVGRVCAGRGERGHEILEGLCDLGGEITGTDYRARRIERNLSGDEDEIAACDGHNLAVAGDRRKGRRIAELNRGCRQGTSE